MFKRTRSVLGVTALAAVFAMACSDPTSPPSPQQANGAVRSGGSGSGGTVTGGGGSTVKVDQIKVSKCFYDVPTGQMLIKAASSDVTARLFAYRPDGTLQGEVQNGGGSRYGGTVMGWIPSDPGTMTIKSSAGGSITVPTTPFQP